MQKVPFPSLGSLEACLIPNPKFSQARYYRSLLARFPGERVRTPACHAGGRVFESVAPAILESPIYRVRGALEILCGCRPQRQVATADSSLKPSRSGSRTGAVFRRLSLAVAPRFLWECLNSQ